MGRALKYRPILRGGPQQRIDAHGWHGGPADVWYQCCDQVRTAVKAAYFEVLQGTRSDPPSTEGHREPVTKGRKVGLVTLEREVVIRGAAMSSVGLFSYG